MSQWYMSTKAGGSGRARRAWFVVGFGFVFEAGRGEVGRGEVGSWGEAPGLGFGSCSEARPAEAPDERHGALRHGGDELLGRRLVRVRLGLGVGVRVGVSGQWSGPGLGLGLGLGSGLGPEIRLRIRVWARGWGGLRRVEVKLLQVLLGHHPQRRPHARRAGGHGAPEDALLPLGA